MLGEPSLKVVTRISEATQRSIFRTCFDTLIKLVIMPRKCSICAHPALDHIDRSLVHGESLRAIAGRFGVSTSSLHRHKQNDLPELLQRAYEDRELARSHDLIGEIEEHLSIGKNILSRALANGDLRLGLSAMRENRGFLSLLGKARGELPAPLKGTVPTSIFSIHPSEAPKLNVEDIQTILPEDKAPELPPATRTEEDDGDDWSARFTPAQREAGRVRRKLLGPGKRATRKEPFRTH